jgi:hypothetical protein
MSDNSLENDLENLSEEIKNQGVMDKVHMLSMLMIIFQTENSGYGELSLTEMNNMVDLQTIPSEEGEDEDTGPLDSAEIKMLLLASVPQDYLEFNGRDPLDEKVKVTERGKAYLVDNLVVDVFRSVEGANAKASMPPDRVQDLRKILMVMKLFQLQKDNTTPIPVERLFSLVEKSLSSDTTNDLDLKNQQASIANFLTYLKEEKFATSSVDGLTISQAGKDMVLGMIVPPLEHIPQSSMSSRLNIGVQSRRDQEPSSSNLPSQPKA